MSLHGVIIIIHHFSVTLILFITLYGCLNVDFPYFPTWSRKFSLSSKMWTVKSKCAFDQSKLMYLWLAAQFPCWVLHASLQIILFYSPLCGPLCHLPSSAYFPEILFPQAFPARQFFFLFLNIYPNVWHDLHTFPSHLPQLNLSTRQTGTLEFHIYSFSSCHWHFLFLAYKCQQVRSNGKRHERLMPQYQHQL